MLGLSLTKVLFTVLVIVAVWRAFALVGRLQALRQAHLESSGGGAAGAAPASRRRRAPSPPAAARAVDLVPCPSCGAYVPRGETCRCRERRP